MELNSCIEKIRRDRELTQIEMCRQTGMSRSYISQLETTRKNNIGSITLHKIAKAYNVTFICDKDGWSYKEDEND